MNRTRLLVLIDAGAAGRILLARRDVDLKWALTQEEAQAVLTGGQRPKLCLTRESQALSLLTVTGRLKNPPPVVVLLEADGWARRDAYFAAGATALVQESAGERILEAVSELTGLAFGQHPRVPFSTVVDVLYDGERHYLETTDLSVSGVTLRGLPGARVGERAELNFVMTEPPLQLSAMVVRNFEEHGEPIAGLCFNALDEDSRLALSVLVDQAQKNAPPIKDPVGFTADLAGAFTADLARAMAQDENACEIYRNMVQEWLASNHQVKIPSWLERVARSLSDIEQAALLGGDAPAFAKDCLDARIVLSRDRFEHDQPTTADRERAIELCQALSVEAAGQPGPVLVQVTEIRSALLRIVYGLPSKRRIGSAAEAAQRRATQKLKGKDKPAPRR